MLKAPTTAATVERDIAMMDEGASNGRSGKRKREETPSSNFNTLQRGRSTQLEPWIAPPKHHSHAHQHLGVGGGRICQSCDALIASLYVPSNVESRIHRPAVEQLCVTSTTRRRKTSAATHITAWHGVLEACRTASSWKANPTAVPAELRPPASARLSLASRLEGLGYRLRSRELARSGAETAWCPQGSSLRRSFAATDTSATTGPSSAGSR